VGAAHVSPEMAVNHGSIAKMAGGVTFGQPVGVGSYSSEKRKRRFLIYSRPWSRPRTMDCSGQKKIQFWCPPRIGRRPRAKRLCANKRTDACEVVKKWNRIDYCSQRNGGSKGATPVTNPLRIFIQGWAAIAYGVPLGFNCLSFGGRWHFDLKTKNGIFLYKKDVIGGKSPLNRKSRWQAPSPKKKKDIIPQDAGKPYKTPPVLGRACPIPKLFVCRGGSTAQGAEAKSLKTNLLGRPSTFCKNT